MRFTPRALLASLAILGLFVVPPLGTAQSGIDHCTRECTPQDVNGPDPKHGADVVNQILYGHFEDALNSAPLNAQVPDEQREPDLDRGFLTPVVDTNTNACVQGTCPGDFHFKNNEFTMFSSPGLVEYLADGWRTHQEPGLAGDAQIAGDEIHLYWYMSSHAVPTMNSQDGPGKTASVGALPQMGVYARMETGRFPFHGLLIAESKDASDAQVGSSDRVNVINVPGQPDVYEFRVSMKVAEHTIPSSEKAQGFVVYVNPYQVKTSQPTNAQVMQEEWRLRTGPKFPPRLIVPVIEPMKTVASTTTIFEDRLFLRWSFLSVWGSYDLRDAELTLRSTGAGKIDPKSLVFVGLKFSKDHDGHFKPVNSTWFVDYTEFPLADGDYELTESIPNLQRTYVLEQHFAFKVVGGVPQVPRIGGGGGSGAEARTGQPVGHSPGLEAPFLIMGIVALAVAARRGGRRRP